MAKVFIEESTLTAIGDAIREKEGSTDLVPVNDMASRISAIAGASGKRFTTGTVIFTIAAAQNTVTHNLGVIPSCVMLYPKDLSVMPPSGTEEAKGKAYKFVYVHNGEFISQGFCYAGSTSSGNYGFGGTLINAGAKASITDTTFTTGTHGLAYKYQPNIEYFWIAIE